MRSKCDIRIRTLLYYILSLSSLCSGYVITTPRRWTSGEKSQVCVTLSSPAASDQTITFEMKSYAKVLIQQTNIVVPEGSQSNCQDIFLPTTTESQGEFTITGSLEGKTISYTKTVAITSEIVETFIQTDKYIYKKSQNVQFRILTVNGVFLKVSLQPYKEIWIENPSGTRLAQWLEVANNDGLIHLSFQLSDEPDEGEYKISVLTSSGKLYKHAFKVEEYVLPRFEVTIKPPNYILGSADVIIFEVCAKYTFGQPVKGNVSISVDNDAYGSNKVIVTKLDEISGCKSFSFTGKQLVINDGTSTASTPRDRYLYIYYAQSLTASAFVTEEGTGIKLDANNVKVQISRTALIFTDISVQKYFKPELPFVGEVLVAFPDGSPTTNEPMTVCCDVLCKTLSTDVKGILKFAIPSHLDCDVIISAPGYPQINSNISWGTIMYKSSFSKSLKKYYSHSNSSLIILNPKDELECTSTEESINFDLTVMFAVNQQTSALINVLVVSRGQIQFSKSFNQEFTAGSTTSIPEELFIVPVQGSSIPGLVIGSFLVSITLPKTVSPTAQVLVWYTRDDGEVVSDSLSISIMECLLNSVDVSWSEEKAMPGSNASVSVKAEPSSLCSLGVVDKSVELLTPKIYLLTIQKLLNLAQKGSVNEYDYKQVDDSTYCQNSQIDFPPLPPPLPLPRPRPLPIPLPEFGIPGKIARRSIIGPWRRPVSFSSSGVDALQMFDEAGVYVLSDGTLEARPCDIEDYWYFPYHHFDLGDFGLVGGLGAPMAGLAAAAAPNALLKSPELQDSGDLTDTSEKEAETVDIRTYFPETWIWSLVLVSNGIYKEDLTLPDTVTEWTASAVCVHSSKGVGISSTASIITFKEFFVDLTLPPFVKRGEVFHVKISIFNYLNEPLPIELTLESPNEQFDILTESGDIGDSEVRTACVPIKDKIVISIRIRAKEVGDVNIGVKAEVKANVVEDCGSGKVQQTTDYLIKPIQVKFEGILKEKSKSKYVCTNDSESGTLLESWNVAAPDSIVPDSARGYVAVTGNLMGPTLENLGSLLRMPYGCGEQNMLNFAPNIFILKYLDASNQNTADITSKAIEFMLKGYQQELKYRLKDGSFSAFGESDGTGSTWLTAFVLKCFGQAIPYITIDLNDLSITADWLKSKQSNKCFESVGRVIHKEMQGGSGSGSPLLLTAYVLIALIESGEDITSKTVTDALDCINKTTEPNVNPYSLAIKAYALALANSTNTYTTIDALLELKTTSKDLLFWTFSPPYGSESVAVETASYAVLAILTFERNSKNSDFTLFVLPIIKWINTQRNSQGGFISTQDTVIALQALAAYEKATHVPPNLVVLVAMGSVENSFSVNDQNKFLQQSAEFPSVPTTITFNITGEGCVLIQSILRYNVPEAKASKAFSLNVTTSTEPVNECKTKIEVCAAYLLPDKNSNMAIIEIDLVSGYIQENEDLVKIIGDGKGVFKRYEINKRGIIMIYVREFTPNELCVSFRISREDQVDNPKPGTVEVYDYYKPEYLVSKTYTLPPSTECAPEGKVEL